MPFDIVDVDGELGSLLTATGTIGGEEYIEAVRGHLTQDPERYRKYRYSLSNYRDVDEIGVETTAVATVAELCKQAAAVNPDAIVAVVAKRDLVFGLSRMWEMMTEGTGWEIHVFRTAEEAREWIRERVHIRFGITGLTFS